MSTTIETDEAKDRLVESLATARDSARAAVVEDVVPAVAAAFGAARDASQPFRAEAASRAVDAVSALRGSGSDAAAALAKSDLGKKAKKRAKKIANRNKPSRGKRIGVLAAIGGLGVAAFAVLKKNSAAPTPYVPAAKTPTPAPAAPPTDAAVAQTAEDASPTP